ncbi:hypothetical protein [Actinoplanes sp. NPDC051851]|uniref:hypothetical protein n=1 Tax=Actinoplanes sp. NPDC051851 TaxID=3154753 RepID=UPI003416004C
MSESGLVARRQAELRLRVGEHLRGGEECGAALWVARVSGLPMVARVTRWQGAPQGVLGFGGSVLPENPESGLSGTAADLHRHLPENDAAAALALTGDRVMLLLAADSPPPEPAGWVRRLVGRGAPEPLPALTPVWECPRSGLAGAEAGDPEGELRLRFADGSGLAVAAPAMLALPFATQVSR